MQKEPKMDPKRGPKAIRAENGKATKLAHSTQDFNDFSSAKRPFGAQNGVQKMVQNGISTHRALESILEASWKALGAL